MCVILYKPKNVKLPSKTTLKNCWERNSDGAGFSYSKKDKVIIDKGYMTFKKFYKAISTGDYTNVDLVIHFRLATHGGVNQKNTHPFPVTDDSQVIHLLDCRSDMAISHNGIISGYGHGQFSDTCDFILQVLSNFRQNSLKIHEVQKFIIDSTRSKFAFHFPNEVFLLGKFELFEDCFYSNSSYEGRAKPIYNTNNFYLNWEWRLEENRWTWKGEKTENPATNCNTCKIPNKKIGRTNEPYFRLSMDQSILCHAFMEEVCCENCRLAYGDEKGLSCYLESKNVTEREVREFLNLETVEYYRQLERGSL